MKYKKLIILPMSIIMIFMFVACGNQQLLDTTYKFDEAIIKLPDGNIVRGKVDSWTDMSDYPTQIQIVIDGVTYLTDISNAVLIVK